MKTEEIIETGLTYDGLTPVRLRFTRRDARYRITDEAAAVGAAGVDTKRLELPDHIPLGEHSVNVSRGGEVWLPAVNPDPDWLETVSALVAKGSFALYDQLLEL